MPSQEYAREKLSVAVYNLATGSRGLPERLEEAYMSFHTLGIEGEPDLPPDLQARFERVVERMTAVPAVGDEGRIRATLRQMSVDDGVELAREICEISSELEHRLDSAG